ncbi:MAG: hypothetical protein M1837_004955 [Sclerophora amabilis]|nr:MAG: hypothetical protein M1837_004955 [Sclerophora amabilis]
MRQCSPSGTISSRKSSSAAAGLSSEVWKSERVGADHEDAKLESVLRETTAILASPSVPSEKAILHALGPCKSFADRVAAASDPQPPQTKDTTPTSSLLSLEEDSPTTVSTPSPPAQPSITSPHLENDVDEISKALYELMRYPPVFITPSILANYVNIQTLLQRPHTLPEIFSLYASKPIPRPGTTPIKYTSPNPSKAQFAIPHGTATLALRSAITQHDLPLCLSIISSTVSTPSFRRNKILRKAVAPLMGLSLAPLAAYAIASRLSELQNTMDAQTATNVAFGGIVTYIGASAMIGLVALTTSNDQMDRVTWATGTPLRERWLREEERAATDRVAAAWGFAESDRRGEEEGEEWEMLREWVGVRGMVLDRVALMEGME